MWQDNQEINENGESITLFQPTSTRPQPINHGFNNNIMVSCAGGPSSCISLDQIPKCAKCNNYMYLLVQINTTTLTKMNDTNNNNIRFVSVFGCPLASCFETLQFSNGFCNNDSINHVFKCIVTTHETKSNNNNKITSVNNQKSAWYNDDPKDNTTTNNNDNEWDDNNNNDDTANDWGDNNNEANLQDLESKLAAMEMKNVNSNITITSKKQPVVASKSTNTTTTTTTKNNNTFSNVFPRFPLQSINEPPAMRSGLGGDEYNDEEEDDDDDVGGANVSDEKIRNMLARYMAEEDDPEILAALQGAATGKNNGGSTAAGAEPDERLSPTEQILLSFQDRLKRAPRQVVRYAKGGKPLWSIPTTTTTTTTSKSKQKKSSTTTTTSIIPNCPHRDDKLSFEFQLLPSLLHLLQVDKYSGITTSNTNNNSSYLLDTMWGGMDWGSIAVYTCDDNNTSCSVTDGYLVIQQSVDERPERNEIMHNESPATMAIVQDLGDDAEFEPDA